MSTHDLGTTSAYSEGVVRLDRDEAPARLQRLRWIAWLLDQSITIGRWRVGIDPLLGLVPGIGDLLGSAISMLILYDGAKLGLPTHVLFRMVGNIVIETVLGVVPVVGDLFDFVWKASSRNLALVERYYDPLRAERSPREIGNAMIVAIVLLTLLTIVVTVLALRALWFLIESVF